MKIAGLQKLSLIDYPGRIAVVVFFPGCNFLCPFCQNPDLVDPKKFNKNLFIKEKDFFDFLKKRKGLLEGVCLTGGEPTIQPDLLPFIKEIKKQGFLVKLDTNGYQPEILEKILKEGLVDFAAMDIKSSPEKYSLAVGKKINLDNVSKSVDLLKSGKMECEFRTTAVPGLIGKNEIKKICQWLKGSPAFALQQFKPEKTLDKEWQKIIPYSLVEMKEMFEIAQSYFEKVELRGV